MKVHTMKPLAVLFFLSATAIAADFHPIVEMDTGYFFGGNADGKWIKAEKAAKSMKGGTPLRVFGLTEEVGKATGGKPKSVEETCASTLTVSLSSTPEDGVIGLNASWNALPRKPRIADPTQQDYVEAVRDFLTGRGIN